MRRSLITVAGLSGVIAMLLACAPVRAEDAHAWLDPKLLAAAKAEGGEMIIYSSTNEGEGLPLFKLFEAATGIKVQYVRAADSTLMSRMALEYRANQKSWDIAQTATINKMPPQLLLQFDPPEAKNISPEAHDPGRRWYGVYANYNSPAYNTEHVKASDLPKTYEEFAQHKEWAGKIAIDGTDNEWLKALTIFYGEDKAVKIVKELVEALKPVVTVGHLALARSVGVGRVLALAQQLRQPDDEREARQGPDRLLGARSGRVVLRPGWCQREGAASEHCAARREFHAQPGMRDLPRQVRPHPDAGGR